MHDAKQTVLSKIEQGQKILVTDGEGGTFDFGRPKDPTAVWRSITKLGTVKDQWSGKVYTVQITGGRVNSGRYGTTHVYVPTDAAAVTTDAQLDAQLAEPATPEDAKALDSDKCGTCKGFAVVRKRGSQAGKAYRTLNGSYAAMGNGNAVDCPVCKGTGLTARVA